MTVVIVSGSMVTKHLNGGEPWVRLSWVRGLSRLGFQVYFLEQIEPEQCVGHDGAITDFERSASLAAFKEITATFGLAGSAALICGNGERVYGMTVAELRDLADSAALLVNITGGLRWSDVRDRIPRKVYIDEDPGFAQFWHAAGSIGSRLAGHDLYFTVGENIGKPCCSIPTGGIPWRPLRQPVVLDDWPETEEGMRDRFTTVASWRGAYGAVEFGGRKFGLKVHEFRKFMELPERAPQAFEIALDIHSGDRQDLDSLQQHGWRVVDPRIAVPDPNSFRRYIQTSGAEFSAAQGIYVETNSGWFSDRTVRYLASGKPALVQETGFSRNYPVGEGLIPFRTLDEAIDGAEKIAGNYDRNARAARALAEEFFDSDTVLGRFADEVGVAS